ncbi:alpha/beta hydrolase fold domain-containing protein [Ditylenchus destructor]|uniref:Alpha/beta hydrolase fold domain-containing protein n=1 Tax=Ditylenchus destructor TaxID=166010 RepID=A0AAD4N8K1_9BILA|nr:alpha/beta hydrolase fold domain-containing protein [Ditylenchus destructor]
MSDYSISDLDRAFSPSYCTANKMANPKAVIDDFIQSQSGHYKENLRGIPHYLDVSYGEQKFDLWGSHLKTPEHIFVFVHGGYWQEGSKDLSTSLVGPLVSNNMVVAVIGYDFAPYKTIPQIVNQVSQAFSYISGLYPASKLILCGHSAGAHLVTKAIEKGCVSANKIALFCGVFTKLEELVPTYIGRDIKLSLEIALESNVDVEKLAKQLSDTKVLILCAEHDAPKIQSQNEEIQSRFTELGVTYECKTISGANHFSIIERLYDSQAEQTKTLLKFIQG